MPLPRIIIKLGLHVESIFKLEDATMANNTVVGGLLYRSSNGTWGSVCDGKFNPAAGAFICKRLGFEGYVSHSQTGDLRLANYSINLDGVSCAPGAVSISDCSYSQAEDCTHEEDILLACYDSPFDLSIISSFDDYVSGLLLFRNSTGSLGTVCDGNFSDYAGSLLCTEFGYAGYSGLSYAKTEYGDIYDYSGDIFNKSGNIYSNSDDIYNDSYPITMDELDCKEPQTLRECSYLEDHDCSHNDDVHLDCYLEGNCHAELLMIYIYKFTIDTHFIFMLSDKVTGSISVINWRELQVTVRFDTSNKHKYDTISLSANLLYKLIPDKYCKCR